MYKLNKYHHIKLLTEENEALERKLKDFKAKNKELSAKKYKLNNETIKEKQKMIEMFFYELGAENEKYKTENEGLKAEIAGWRFKDESSRLFIKGNLEYFEGIKDKNKELRAEVKELKTSIEGLEGLKEEK